ncbi:MAG: type II toxin-antitoxin system mRNA interferase toxin, RelE/StbE family [Anaerolinea sp.]|nr:type II toxin-antitoxin system mRNA interferase toxin, RelE/StbE family [Anaerolinea sp.]
MSEVRWQVRLLKGPQKILRKLPADARNRLLVVLHQLEVNAYPEGCKKLTGYEHFYRIRAGDWRIIYSVESGELVILVLEIGARGGVYKNLEK